MIVSLKVALECEFRNMKIGGAWEFWYTDVYRELKYEYDIEYTRQVLYEDFDSPVFKGL